MSGWEKHTNKFQNTFFGRVAILSTGHATAQLMPILLTPFITRLYSSSQLGELALFVAAVNITTQFSCLKYDFAITVAPDDDTAWQLLLLSVFFSVFFSLLMFALFPFYPSVVKLIGGENNAWIYFIPLGSLITATEISMINYNIYSGRYKRVSKANIIRGAIYCTAQIVLYNWGTVGLIVSQIMSNAVTITYLAAGSKFGRLNKKDLKQIAVKYKSYPKYMVVGAVAGAANSNLQSFFISAFYGSTQTGYYAVVNRLLGTPLTVISTAIGQVFLKQSAVELQQKGKIISAKKLTLLLALLVIPIFGGIYLVSPWLVNVFLGSGWSETTLFIKTQLILFAVRFVTVPVTLIAPVLKKQKATMIWQFVMLLLSVLSAGIALISDLTVSSYLIYTSAFLSVGYLIFLCYCIKISQTVSKGGKNADE